MTTPQAAAIQRYSDQRIEDEEGIYVLYADHVQALAREREKLWKQVRLYIGHRGSCSYGVDTPDGDFCTCDLNKIRALGREIEQQASDAEGEG